MNQGSVKNDNSSLGGRGQLMHNNSAPFEAMPDIYIFFVYNNISYHMIPKTCIYRYMLSLREAKIKYFFMKNQYFFKNGSSQNMR